MRGFRAAWLFVLFSCATGPVVFGGGTGRALFVAFLPTESVVSTETTSDDIGIVEQSAIRYLARDSVGMGLEYSQRFGRWFGVTAHFSYTRQTFERHEHTLTFDSVSGAQLGESVVDMTDTTVFAPLLGVFDIHMLRPGRFDLHAGPLFGYTWYDTLFGGIVDDHFVSGVNLGFDVVLSDRWALSTTAIYFDSEAEPQHGASRLRKSGEINVDPLQFEFGVAYRFDGPAR